MRRVRIVLVEDNEVFREALELMLGMREEVEVVAAVGDGAAVDAVLEHRPDVVLVDAEASKELLAQLPGVGVACLHKDQEVDEIVAAIREAAST